MAQTPKGEWDDLLPEGCLRDERLRRRAIDILQGLMRHPGSSFGAAFADCSSQIKAAYRFVANESLDLPKVLTPSFRAVGGIARASPGTVLCIHDSTELDLSNLTATTGLGEIGNPVGRGFFVHSGLAVTPGGVPLGLLAVQTWTRDPTEHGKTEQRHERPFDDKESSRWWKSIAIAERATGEALRLIHVCDREIDSIDVFARCQAEGVRLLARARTDRRLRSGDCSKLWAEAESWPVRGQRTVYVPPRPPKNGHPAIAGREATVTLRFGDVRFGQRVGDGQLGMSVILVREEPAPVDTEPIDWLLLTTDLLHSPDDAFERVDWYARRWLIEEFHKCLKSGCQVEERQFKAREHFEVALALFLLVSVRILQMRNLSRVEPEAPASIVLTKDEETVLLAYLRRRSKDTLALPLSIATAVRTLALLGGFLGRTSDGPPGFLTLWRGYEKLDAMVDGYLLAAG